MPAPRPLTPDALAERWGCSAETIRQMVKRGEIEAFRVGRPVKRRPRSWAGGSEYHAGLSTWGWIAPGLASEGIIRPKKSRADRRVESSKTSELVSESVGRI